MAKIIFLISTMLLSSYLTEQAQLSDDHNVIEKKNKVINTLKTEENVDPNSAVRAHFMMLKRRKIESEFEPDYLVGKQIIHKGFDARKHWPKCKTIGEVHNDGNRKSNLSWAYATTGAFADRMCIATNGKYNQLLSTEELISCSGMRSAAFYDSFVDQMNVWDYFKSHGLVSGGRHNTNEGCQPSRLSPICNLPKKYVCNHTCYTHCYGNNTIDYNHDHVKVNLIYHISYENIIKELKIFGPVSAAFALYDDFFVYKSGVYTKSENAKFVRYQFAKLIGWGVEGGVDYWLLINSWGTEWGQNGLFKIKRGTNECGIDNHTYAGVPEIYNVFL